MVWAVLEQKTRLRECCELLFTPPYSSEFNPIKEAWAKLKDVIRRAENKAREAFDTAVAQALEMVDCGDIYCWFSYARCGLYFG